MIEPVPLTVGYRHLALETCVSTNTECLNAAARGEETGLWITSDRQSGGKGSRGRDWVSEIGNLFASLLLINPSDAKNLPELTFVASLALQRAISTVLPQRTIQLKWPNDVLIEGRKCSGILLESSISKDRLAAVIGIGVNCVSHPSDTRFPATNLSKEGGSIEARQFFPILAEALSEMLTVWDRGNNFDTIRQQWIDVAWGIGKTAKINLHDGSKHEGRYLGLTETGHMILKEANGRRLEVSVGDIFAVV